MTDEELRKKLREILGRFGTEWSDATISIDIADIRRAFREAGYLSPAELKAAGWRLVYPRPFVPMNREDL